jgi:hypothetical protein
MFFVWYSITDKYLITTDKMLLLSLAFSSFFIALCGFICAGTEHNCKITASF